MRAMLDVIYRNGQSKTYDCDWVTGQIDRDGFWVNSDAKTPNRTVNKNFSQSPDVFDRVEPNRYRLRPEYYRLSQPIVELTNSDSEPKLVTKVPQTVYRTLRDTELVRKLKLMHEDQCQICGLAIRFNDTTYSEGHHIKPLGKDGPDNAGNILILCPNHHVQCDYGAIRLDRAELRADSRHVVSEDYIRWHNEAYGL